MAKNANMAAFIAAAQGRVTLSNPFDLFPKSRTRPSGVALHRWVKTPAKTQQKTYPIILLAVALFSAPDCFPKQAIQLVSRKGSWEENGAKIKGKEYLLERLMVNQDGSFLVYKKGSQVRLSFMEWAGNVNNAVGDIGSQDPDTVASILMACLPEIMQKDRDDCGGALSSKVESFASFLPDTTGWKTSSDLPEQFVEDAFDISEIISSYLEKCSWSFAVDATTPEPEPVADDIVLNFSGATVISTDPSLDWRYAKSNGATDSTGGKVPFGAARKQYSGFMAHRNWTPAEKALIPVFPEDMPVPEWVLRICDLVVKTKGTPIPVCNALVRGGTGLGKTTGVQIMAGILGMPYLAATCHSTMELSDMQSTMVPVTDDSEGVDDGIRVRSVDSAMSPVLTQAVQYWAAKEPAEREAFLSGEIFFSTVMFDPDGASFDLFGEAKEMSEGELCSVYSDMKTYFRELPLRSKIAELEQTAPTSEQGKDVSFKLVMSSLYKAMANGYLCEVQEASRVLNSGTLVGLNNTDMPGSVIPLMNGKSIVRSQDCIVLYTDNTTCNSCRPLDQSVIRRFAFVLDLPELEEADLKERTRRNTGCKDEALLNKCFNLWKTVKEYCEVNAISDGSVSPVELDRFLQYIMVFGEDSLDEALRNCVVSKATMSAEDQRDILTACSIT